jgi:Zn-dependent protease
MVLKNLQFNPQEIRDIFVSIIALGFIFSLGSAGQLARSAGITENSWIVGALMMTFILGISFLPHELAHKFVAIKYNCYARYEMWKTGLLIALGLAIITGGNFVFAAPGAVVIYTQYFSRRGIEQVNLSSKQNAYISAAGPLTNIAIALLAFGVAMTVPLSLFMQVMVGQIVFINAFLAMFNLLPIPPLDGSKIIWWNIAAWVLLMAASVGLYIGLRFV